MELATGVPCVQTGLLSAVLEQVGGAMPAEAWLVRCENTVLSAGAWLRDLGVTEDAAARERGLIASRALQGNENVAFRAPEVALRSRMLKLWQGQPKHLDHDLVPNGGAGPVHLTSYELTLDSPSKSVALRMDGYDSQASPDISFWYETKGTFSLEDGAIQCTASTDFEVDDTLHWLLAGISLGLSLSSPFDVPLALGLFGQAFATTLVDTPSGGESMCDAIALVPTEILLREQAPFIPRHRKLAFVYDRVSVSGGVGGGGTWVLAPRLPEVQAGGTRYIDVTAPSGGPVTLTALAVARTTDMIDPQLTFTTAGASRIESVTQLPTFQTRRIQWQVPSVQAGDTIRRDLTVSATDAEGLQASGSTFFVFRIHAPEPVAPSTVCIQRPWLPNCGSF